MERYFGKCLSEYCDRDLDAWHMPGHKRSPEVSETSFTEMKRYDVTELPGLDDLHAAEGALRESMQQLCEVYGSYKSYYLVNGSTCGILTAISAVCKRGDTIIMARNCHKSVYHIVALLELHPVYIYPEIIEPWNMCGGMQVEQVREALEKHPEAKAVVFPSPTYEGIVSDVQAISAIAHQKNVCVIVDEAHGAHLEFDTQKILPAIRCGADLVIESLHKTLPCFNQCALLHISKQISKKDRDIVRNVEKYLNVYETSSPSYIFVADMEHGIVTADAWRTTGYAEYGNRLCAYRRKWEALKVIQVLKPEEIEEKYNFKYDQTKIVIHHANLSGEELREILENEYGIVVEMASLYYVLAMSSVMDDEGMFERLDRALQDLDRRPALDSDKAVKSGFESLYLAVLSESREVNEDSEDNHLSADTCITYIPGVAWNKESSYVNIMDAVGKVAGEYVTVYPPGIPVCVPGEIISSENVQYLKCCYEDGLTIHGIHDGKQIFLE